MDVALMRTLLTAVPDIDEPRDKTVDQILAASRKFLDWEIAAMRRQEPADQDKKDHETSLRLLIRIVKILLNLEENKKLRALQIRLNESWETFYNPLDEVQADFVLANLASK